MIPTYLPVVSGSVEHTADALNFTKEYLPGHLGLAVTFAELPIIEIIIMLHLILIFHSFVMESSHTVVLEENVDKQKETAFKNKT